MEEKNAEPHKLRLYLSQCPAGELPPDKSQDVKALLKSCWHDLGGHGFVPPWEELWPFRSELRTIAWRSPIIECEAGCFLYVIDLDARKMTTHNIRGKIEARGVTEAILHGKKHQRIVWDGKSRVCILDKSDFPPARMSKENREQFWKALEESLLPHGWNRDSRRSSFFTREKR